MTIITTSRLALSELSEADAPFIVELLNSPGWLRFIGDREVRNDNDARAYIVNGPVKSYIANQFGLWLVSTTDQQQPIGICGLIKRNHLPHPDLGFAFLPQFIGHGFARESAEAVLKHAANTLKIPVVNAITTDENLSSLKLLFKLGFAFIGLVQNPGEDEELMLLEKQL
ncbi:MAG: GNAT family N-acetyltransferase [Taibaiella sp.]|nr:GNAT family N-acetyltransferase [Taibaiella sp.]